MPARDFVMLVSAAAGSGLRAEVAEGRRPCPEFLRLEGRGVELLDWSRLVPAAGRRSPWTSIRHVIAALRRLDRFDAVFSDGEQVGVPLALGMLARQMTTPHLMIGHHLTGRRKRFLLRTSRCHRGISRILVHSRQQLEDAERALGIPGDRLAFIPYHADAGFWSPGEEPEERLIVSAGREHRDYATLAAAVATLDAPVFVADGSVHAPHAPHRAPAGWPANVSSGFAGYPQLRNLFARAAVVVVPLVDNDFQAGVTTILEAMAMAKPVIVTASRGQRDVVEDGVTGRLVPPADAESLREAILSLLGSAAERRRLGDNARQAVLEGFSLEAYVSGLLGHLEAITAPRDSFRAATRRERTA
ncbi:MAG: glycosyltransferase family 4 protein [Candidatus Dormibacteraceae bacterium]